jgi:hypothetical protein
MDNQNKKIKKNKDNKSLGLLNFEGDVLKAYYLPTSDSFLIVDDQGKYIKSLSKKELEKFFNGDIELTTSYGKTYNYANEHQNAKPKQEKIDEFIALMSNKPKKEKKEFTRKELIDAVDRAFFFLSDNGDADITGKEFVKMYYPKKKK